MTRRLWNLPIALLMASGAWAQTWFETVDAPSFPDGQAQVTRGSGALASISGTTDSGAGDQRDAYCIRILEPDSFLATTDPMTDPAASATFDTRLLLFRPDGAPVLAAEDTPGSTTGLSTLTGVATDGSGFTLTQPGEYVLIVTSFQDDPQDAADVDLFDIGSPFDLVWAPDPAAGRFDDWSTIPGSTGTYNMVLDGVGLCQSELDAVFAVSGVAVESLSCLGDGGGGFDCSGFEDLLQNAAYPALGFVDGDPHLDAVIVGNDPELSKLCQGDGTGNLNCAGASFPDLVESGGVALGFVDDDQFLDAVFANSGQRNRVCLGSGLGTFTCSDVSTDTFGSASVALGFIDSDQNLDAVFANFQGERSRICLGDGAAGFTCSDISTNTFATQHVVLGFVDGNQHLDAVFANTFDQRNRVCLGVGNGTFSCADVSTDTADSNRVALGDLNGDQNLDAVFANWDSSSAIGDRNRVCLGDGSGGFACSDVSTDANSTFDVALGLVDGGPNLDVVFANLTFGGGGEDRVCFGDGVGGFFNCSNVTDDTPFTIGVALGELNSPTAGEIFTDGFESGDTSSWTSTVGEVDNRDIGVFVSSSSTDGDFGGTAVADATCQSLGTAAIPGSGPWVAWLSEAGADARNRIPQPGQGRAYVRASQTGTVIANDLADLTDGTLTSSVGNLDENGNAPPAPGIPWTGTDADGTIGADTCSDWASNQNFVGGIQGSRFATDSTWTNSNSAGCDQLGHFYCFGELPP